MTLEHKVPTQKEIDAYISSAKDLRRKVLADMGCRVLSLPSTLWQAAISVRLTTVRT